MRQAGPSNLIRGFIVGLTLLSVAACSDTSKSTGSKGGAGTAAPPIMASITPITWQGAVTPINSASAAHLVRTGSMLGHNVTVNHVVFSHDSQSVLSQDGNGRALVWNTQTGQQRYGLSAGGPLLIAYFSPDDKRIITVSFDNQVRTWDASSGAQTSATPPDAIGYTAAVYTTDGGHLAVGRNDGTISLWSGLPTQPSASHVQGTVGRLIRALAFSRDGGLLASIASDDVVRIWETTGSTTKATLTGFRGAPLQAVFSPDATLLAVALGVELHIFSTATFTEKYVVTQPDLAAQRGMAFSPDNRLIAAGSTGAFVYVWDTVTTHVVGRLTGHDGNFSALSWSPDGSLLFTTALSPQAGAYVWNATSFKPDATSYPRGAVSASGEGIYTGGWSPDGKQLVTADVQGALIVWGIPAGR